MMKNTYILTFGLMFLLFSCGENTIEEPNESIYGYEYFPLDIGYTWVYQVDSTLIIQGGSSNKVTSSFVQERVTELISEVGDEKTYKIERSTKSDMDASWDLQKVWQVSRSSTVATKTEDNLKFIKLVFPATKGKKWDGNSFFDSNKLYTVAADDVAIYQGWDYKIEEVELERTFNDILYPKVIRVTHIDEVSLISRRFSEEYYAEGVGLLNRDMQIFDSQNGDTLLSWLERAEKGFQLNQTLISFSKN